MQNSKGFLASKLKSQIETKIKSGETVTEVESQVKALIDFDQLSEAERQDLKAKLSKITLLSDGKVNPKTAKQVAGYHFENYILHLTPSDLSGVNLCPKASQGCKAACLNFAGRGRFDSIQVARLRKTLYFATFRVEFLSHLSKEIGKALIKAKKRDAVLTVRLNGTSDLPWESMRLETGRSIIETYQDVTFYDYTKIVSRIEKIKNLGLKNYHLTFSASEVNGQDVIKALSLGVNVATVFDSMPETYQGRDVINGDSHDFRFLDRRESQGLILGLKAKGPAKRDLSGFVKRVSDQNKKTA